MLYPLSYEGGTGRNRGRQPPVRTQGWRVVTAMRPILGLMRRQRRSAEACPRPGA